MPEQQDPLIGQTLGEFKILRLIGVGGMGKVYLAEQVGLERQVAVKVLPQQIGQDQSAISRFEREGRLAAKLTHPNIAHVYTIGAQGGAHYVAMEYVGGGDVAARLKQKGRLSLEEAVSILRQALLAIGTAHANGIIHRDIKPHNLMIASDGTVKVTDFGLARAVSADSSLTASGAVLGTPLYMSPEQAEGKPVDKRTDLYALGTTFYHMVCGRPPFEGDTPVSILVKHVTEPLTSPKEIAPDVPDELCRIIGKMMAKQPDERYHSCEEVLADLDAYLRAQGTPPGHAIGQISPIRPISSPSVEPADMDAATSPAQSYGRQPTVVDESPRTRPIRKRVGHLLLGAVAIAAVVGLVYLLKSGEEPRQPVEPAPRESVQPPPTKPPEKPTVPVPAATLPPALPKIAYENLLGMKFVKIPAGELLMGLSDEEVKGLVAAHRLNQPSEAWIRALETPQHRVRITRGFYMGIHEVTQGQFRQAMGRSPAKHRGDNRPAETDDWGLAEAFCRWLNTHDSERPEGYEYRLPTEAEWEYACRAGSTGPHHFGPDAGPVGGYAWYSGNSPRVTHDVGLKEPNAWGLYDMYGNVWEWCEDWFSEDYYKGSPTNDPRNRRSGPNRVARGASWGDPAFWCRSTIRIGPPKLYPIGNHGFRVVLAPKRGPVAIPQYLIADLSGGQNAKHHPVTALRDGPPADLLTDKSGPNGANKYKTTHLVVRRIPAGRFVIGSPRNEPGHEPDEVQHEVLLTRDYYAGVFEATQAQYRLVMGVSPSKLGKAPEAPVETVSWIEVRGGKWPGGRAAPGSFLGRLSARTGLAFDLPTDAQWEYACRAGTATSYNSGRNLARGIGRDEAMDEVGWYKHNAGGRTHPVGLKRPNAWGLYDFHGNVWEWCLNWFHVMSTRPMADPVGPENQPGRLLRGGWWRDEPNNCRSAERTGNEPDSHDNDGFRVFLPETGNVTLYENELGMKFVGIPAGEFLRGTPEAEVKALAAKHKGDEWFVERLQAEAPQHKVRITEDFLMGCCEVTVGQFRKFVEATGHKTLAERRGGADVFAGGKWQRPPDAGWRNPYYTQTDSHPVTCVSWHDAKAFCNWLNWWDNSKPKGFAYRLATGAEWEYACRAGTTTAYSFGSDPAAVADYGWTNKNSGGQAHEVARKKVIASVVQDKNGNAWGLYDMHGNVWEWCEDWYRPDAYQGAAEEDPINMKPSGKRTMRGGSWRTSPESARAAFRTEDPPDGCWNNVGFRVVLSPRKASKPRDLRLAWTSEEANGTYCIAWADFDKDGDPDLAVGNKWGTAHNHVYRNDAGRLVLAWTAPLEDATESDGLAWGDWDGDGDPDLAVGDQSGPIRVYENTHGKLAVAWSSPEADKTMGVAWADWDGDGDLDLAVANEAEPNRVYQNEDGKLVVAWTSAEKDNTRSVAWADWDNDGDLDLACGNEGQQNRVYENIGGDLVLAWSAKEKDQTVCAVWADVDGDGFPDLACGNKGVNRLYRNVPGSERIAEYQLNGDAKDTSGNDRHGGVIGTEPVRDRFGTPNAALYFDGQDDVVEVTDFVNYQFPVEFSLSFWFRTETPLDKQLRPMIQQMTGPNNVSSFSVRGHTGGFFLELVEPGGRNHVWRYPLTDYRGQWQHVVVVKERTEARTYLNSALIGTHYANFNLNLSNQPLNIGGSKTEKGLYFDGMIDDVVIVAKALTERDVSRLYNEGNWPMLDVLGQHAVQKLQAALKKNDPKYNGQGRLVTEGDKIVEAWFANTGITDISPLKGQPLRLLELYKTTVGDISVVKDMPLEWLNLTDTTVTDLSALKGKPLKRLIMHRCPVADLTPLEGAPLERLTFDPHHVRKGLDILRKMKTLRHIGANWGERSQPAAEFWKKYDAGK